MVYLSILDVKIPIGADCMLKELADCVASVLKDSDGSESFPVTSRSAQGKLHLQDSYRTFGPK